MMLRKIPLDVLINLLSDIYDGGADYVDISSDKISEDQDLMKITVKEEYYKELDPDALQDIEIEFLKEDAKEEGFSDTDINDLI